MIDLSSWSLVALLSRPKGCWVPDGGRVIYAFGTQPCYFDGRDEGISDQHKTRWCFVSIMAT
ncbi:hypothetical protein BDV59DRAFT_183520 [Aspergillus ambiguus]|uniref:uncharacterized protein n=1 Tax=Aspergillus ambiguus TaxID=176160 RepID=UPI003CCE5274